MQTNDQQKQAEDRAMRFNHGKPQWSLVHFASLLPMVRVLEYGAQKYTVDNWKKPMERRKILDSMMRHVQALMDGEEMDFDPNCAACQHAVDNPRGGICSQHSGMHHIGHIMCNAMFYEFQRQHESPKVTFETTPTNV